MGIYTFLTNGAGLLVTFAFPFALEAISWRLYMINGAYDVLQIGIIMWLWVETKGRYVYAQASAEFKKVLMLMACRTLEEIDESLDGKKHFGEEGQIVYGVEPGSSDERSVDGGNEKGKIVPKVFSTEHSD